MLTEYFHHQQELEKMYGQKAVVLYQCGGFFEVYEERMCTCAEPRPPETKEPRLCPNCRCVCSGMVPRGKASVMRDVWNTAMPAKSTRFWMAGFPSDNRPAFVRHLRTLTTAGWTAAVYRQHDSTDVNRLATKQEKVRLLSKIYSRGTYGRNAEDDPRGAGECLSPLATGSKHLTMCVFIRQTCLSDRRFPLAAAQAPDDLMYELGVATFDIDTQEVACGETYTLENDTAMPFARLRALLCECRPREFLVACDSLEPDEAVSVLRRNSIVLPETGAVVRRASPELQRAPKRESIFRATFMCGQTTGIPVAQRIGVARQSVAAIALAELVVFVEHHDAGLVVNLPVPSRVFGSGNLVLHTTTLRQLDVIPPPEVDEVALVTGPTSLLEVVDNCVTPFGRDLLRERLCRPSTDAPEIRRRTGLVASLLTAHQSVQGGFKHLAQLHRIVARLRSHRVTYPQIGALARMVSHALKLYDGPLKKLMQGDTGLQRFVHGHLPAKDRDRLQALRDELAATFVTERLAKVSAADPERTSCFRPGIDEAVDTHTMRLGDLLGYLRSIGDALRGALPPVKVGNRKKPVAVAGGDVCVAATAAEKRRYHFELTTLATKSMKSVVRLSKRCGAVPIVPASPAVHTAFEGWSADYPDDKRRASWADKHKVSTYNGRSYVCFDWQVRIADELAECHRDLAAATKARFREVVSRLHDRYYDVLHRLFMLVAELDVAASGAAVASAYSYTMPVVAEDGPSRLVARGLRHPIIERLDTATEYVDNDVCFGAEKGLGYLVHGVNAAGKSSLMKSVGLAVIMAQAGLFVPAARLELRPYRNLFTCILKRDNLFLSLSSFQMEILGIGDIIRRCDGASLVIGDELCSGTETTSAVAIVGASIDHLSRRGTHFMFATHLHELQTLPDIATNPGVRFVHMSVETDSAGALKYTRKLTTGSGPDTYGVEACSGFGLPADFLRRCKRYRAFLKTGGTSGLRASSYNRTVLFGGQCAVAGCGRPSADMHHIVHQQHADAGTGHLSDGRHKNARSNLMPLCKYHHQRAHRPGAPDIVAKWVMTSAGPRIEILDSDLDNSCSSGQTVAAC